MGSWRRVGAFLGLVPDDGQQYDGNRYDANSDQENSYENGYDGDSYHENGYDGDRSDGHGYSGARVSGGYRAAGYDDDHGASEDRAHDRAHDRDHADDYVAAAPIGGSYVGGGYAGPVGRGAYTGSSPFSPSEASDLDSAGRSGESGRPRRRSLRTDAGSRGPSVMRAEPRRDADAGTPARPASVKLTGFGEARVVGEKYRDGQSVILDMTDMSDADARRLVDFSAGLAFSLRGSIEKVAPKVFMLLPAEADIAGGAAHALEDARAYVGGSAGR